jgi:hypothetical protein
LPETTIVTRDILSIKGQLLSQDELDDEECPRQRRLAASVTAVSSNTTDALLAITVILVYYYYRSVCNYFKRRGLPRPTPYPLVAICPSCCPPTEWEFVASSPSATANFMGYSMASGRFVVCDADVLRQICIKDFDAMPNHEAFVSLNDLQKLNRKSAPSERLLRVPAE